MACPRDGEPLRNSPTADSGSGTELYCKFCGWEFPRDWIRPEPL
jgi:transposase